MPVCVPRAGVGVGETVMIGVTVGGGFTVGDGVELAEKAGLGVAREPSAEQAEATSAAMSAKPASLTILLDVSRPRKVPPGVGSPVHRRITRYRRSEDEPVPDRPSPCVRLDGSFASAQSTMDNRLMGQ